MNRQPAQGYVAPKLPEAKRTAMSGSEGRNTRPLLAAVAPEKNIFKPIAINQISYL